DMSEADSPAAGANGAEADSDEVFSAEISAKLDLAAAYQEIGDQDGARELLEEVMRGGSNVQLERARAMLDKLK
ncbi:FimV/HubP family polar landmark protein, partial [Herbaspirillum sp. RTI4]